MICDCLKRFNKNVMKTNQSVCFALYTKTVQKKCAEFIEIRFKDGGIVLEFYSFNVVFFTVLL